MENAYRDWARAAKAILCYSEGGKDSDMPELDIKPTENRDRHLKVYIEPSLYAAIVDFQVDNKLFSVSDAARKLLIHALKCS